jgi:hypothetical protein
MSSIDSIPQFSAAEQMARTQAEVSMKVMKLANQQGEATAQLVEKTMENLQSTIENFASGLGDTFDAQA